MLDVGDGVLGFGDLERLELRGGFGGYGIAMYVAKKEMFYLLTFWTHG